ncbi:MAG: hypothetical protein AAFX99_18535 [Myxococcota bacterium]
MRPTYRCVVAKHEPTLFWPEFAQQHGLNYRVHTTHPEMKRAERRVYGSYHGHNVEVSLMCLPYDARCFTIQAKVELDASYGDHDVKRRPWWRSKGSQTGDRAFDRLFMTDHPEQTSAALRRVMVALIGLGFEDCRVSDGKLVCRVHRGWWLHHDVAEDTAYGRYLELWWKEVATLLPEKLLNTNKLNT